MRAGRGRLAVAIACGAMLGTTGTAAAETTVEMKRVPGYANPVLVVTGDDSGSRVTLRSDIDYRDDDYGIKYDLDVIGGVEIGDGCIPTQPKHVVCERDSESSGNSAIIETEGGPDTVVIRKNQMNKATVEAGEGHDHLRGFYVDDLELHGGPGADLLESGPYGSVELFGEGGDDRILGGRYGNTLIGGPGADVLRGKGGSDVLRGADRREDRIINCGVSQSKYDDHDRAFVDLADGKPRECETYIVIQDNDQ